MADEHKINKIDVSGKGIKFSIKDETELEVARAYLYILKNDLHEEPFGFMEDVYVAESERGKGLGTKVVNALIAEAKEQGCYKLICTSRHEKNKVHSLYEKIGFKNHGNEFRIDF
jgi:GNAT superfamily N-acetyltransferase